MHRTLLSLALLMGLTACGLQPMYAGGRSGARQWPRVALALAGFGDNLAHE